MCRQTHSGNKQPRVTRRKQPESTRALLGFMVAMSYWSISIFSMSTQPFSAASEKALFPD